MCGDRRASAGPGAGAVRGGRARPEAGQERAGGAAERGTQGESPSLPCSPWQLSSLALVAFGKCVGGGQE